MNINILIASYLSESSPCYFYANSSSYEGEEKKGLQDLVETSQSGISALDRSINYGDGCFTTMYYENGSIFLLDEHLNRLEQDAQNLAIQFQVEAIKYWLIQACNSLLVGKIDTAAIKILVTRGVGGRGYEAPKFVNPQIIIGFHLTQKLSTKFPGNNSYSFCVQTAKLKLSSQLLLAGIKHLSRLEQVLAKQELLNENCDDLLLSDQSNNIVEATAANLFILNNGVWISPKIVDCGVNGVMRKNIFDYMMANSIPCELRKVTTEDIENAESMFLCNALKVVVPVTEFRSPKQNIKYEKRASLNMLSQIYDSMKRYDVILAKGPS